MPGGLLSAALPPTGGALTVQSALMAGVDAGVLVTCSGCGNTVLQKAMVPVLVTADPGTDPAKAPEGAAAGGGTMGYLCIACARLRIAIPAEEAAPVDGAVAAG